MLTMALKQRIRVSKMTDEEFEELKTKYTKELERRKRLESALGDIEHIQNCKKDNPSSRVRNKTITLNEE